MQEQVIVQEIPEIQVVKRSLAMKGGHGPIRNARTMPKGARNSCSVFIGDS